MKSFIAVASIVALAQAFSPLGAQTYGALLTPNTGSPVTTGQDYTVTWTPNTPADGVTVSLVLCNGPGANCVLQGSAIAEGIPAGPGSYTWSVPCSLPEGVASTATGYGMLIIVDGTGEFQYSTQFSVQKGATCGSSVTTTTTSPSSSSSSSSSTTSSSSSSSAAPTSSVWNSWESTLTTSTVLSTPAAETTVPAVLTTPAGTTYQPPSSSAVATSATPKPFTGAAAVPTAFANAAGLVGAAALAMLAL